MACGGVGRERLLPSMGKSLELAAQGESLAHVLRDGSDGENVIRTNRDAVLLAFAAISVYHGDKFAGFRPAIGIGFVHGRHRDGPSVLLGRLRLARGIFAQRILDAVQIGVDAAHRHQLLVRTDLRDLSLVEYDDTVCVLDG